VKYERQLYNTTKGLKNQALNGVLMGYLYRVF
jgi:hypothetical protein